MSSIGKCDVISFSIGCREGIQLGKFREKINRREIPIKPIDCHKFFREKTYVINNANPQASGNIAQ